MKKAAKRKNAVLNSLEIAGIALLLVFALWKWVVFPYPVVSSSMEPALSKTEWALVLRESSLFGSLRDGDIVLLRSKVNAFNVFKRIQATPGSRQSITVGHQPLVLELKDGDFLVLGDREDFSMDSRYYGPVAKEYIIGKAILVIWPLQALRRIVSHA